MKQIKFWSMLLALAAMTMGLSSCGDENEDEYQSVLELQPEIAENLCPDKNHPHMIDLGFGVSWACCNVGAASPEDWGGYYAWGETEEKKDYTWDNYKYQDAGKGLHYCTIIGDEIGGTQYDVATAKWGEEWKIPSASQLNELKLKLKQRWAKLHGVYGCLFTNEQSGKSIFMPAAGYRDGKDIRYRDIYGCYWSSSCAPSSDWFAQRFYFSSGHEKWNDNWFRHYGRPVRAIAFSSDN